MVVKKAIITHFFGKTRFRPNISVSIDEFKQTILKLLEEIDSKEDTVCDRAYDILLESYVDQVTELQRPRKNGLKNEQYILSFDADTFKLKSYIGQSGKDESIQQIGINTEETAAQMTTESSLSTNNKGKKKTETNKKNDKDKNDLAERELYDLVRVFVSNDSHFTCYSQVINAQAAQTLSAGEQKWGYPDLAGVSYPFGPLRKQSDDAMESECLSLAKLIGASTVVFFSFEVKVEVTYSNLKECFFQAVSNSSWANEGYLVAANYKEFDKMRDEMQRLTNAFGIGFIQLDLQDFSNSKILIPAHYKEELDWITINKFVKRSGNSGFKEFVKGINQIYENYELYNLRKVSETQFKNIFTEKYGKHLSLEEANTYISEKMEQFKNRVSYLKQTEESSVEVE